MTTLSRFPLRLAPGVGATLLVLSSMLTAAVPAFAQERQATGRPPAPTGVGIAPDSPGDELTRKLDEFMRAAAEAYDLSGAVLVARNGTVAYRGATGYADAAAKIRNTPDTRFRIGSVTKPFTAIVVMSLQEQGKLSVTDAACKYLASCPEAWAGITIRHLLSHTSGLPNITSLPDYTATMGQRVTPAQTLDRVRNMPLEFEPGAQFKYSNTGYVALGAIVETVTGRPYIDVVKATILEPLGMKNTGYESLDGTTPGLAVGYQAPKPGSNAAVGRAAFIDMSVPHAAGALYSTVDDLLAFGRAVEHRKLLSNASWDAMTTPVKGNYGYGLIIQKLPNGTTLLNHDGGINGFSASFTQVVEPDVTVVLLQNTDRALSISRDLLNIALGGPYSLPKKRVAVKLDPTVYDAYVGVYEIQPGFTLTVSRDGDRLLTQGTGQATVEVFPQSETEFFLTVVDAQITFVKDADGAVTKLVLHQGGRDIPAKRIR